ncbi:MAG: hypothetical protein ACRD4S_17185 [Candidatus Acidiferrales bacterium]
MRPGVILDPTDRIYASAARTASSKPSQWAILFQPDDVGFIIFSPS